MLDSRLLAPRAAEAAGIDVARLFAHEGWHVALRNRGEDFGAAKRLNLKRARAHFLAQALIVIEEFRVERALCEQGLPLHDTYEESTSDVFVELQHALLDAVTLRYPSEDINRTYDSVLRAFNALTIHFAYLAADHVVSAGERTIGTVSQSSSWTRYVGSNWDALISVLQPIPSASKGAEIEIDAVAGSLATALQAWLKDVGFDLSDVPGGVYFDVLRHDF